jgi:hypothetical protein
LARARLSSAQDAVADRRAAEQQRHQSAVHGSASVWHFEGRWWTRHRGFTPAFGPRGGNLSCMRRRSGAAGTEAPNWGWFSLVARASPRAPQERICVSMLLTIVLPMASPVPAFMHARARLALQAVDASGLPAP